MIMNKKLWFRWVSILLICAVYYLVVFYYDLVFAVNFSETMSQGGDLTSSQCAWLVKTLLQNHNDSALASSLGFAVCVPLIIFIFKKVR